MPEPAAPRPDPGPATTRPRPSLNGTVPPKPSVPPMPSEVTNNRTAPPEPQEVPNNGTVPPKPSVPPWNQAHLLHALREFEQFYNSHRPHRGIANARPLCALPSPIPEPTAATRLGGILHEYRHAA